MNPAALRSISSKNALGKDTLVIAERFHRALRAIGRPSLTQERPSREAAVSSMPSFRTPTDEAAGVRSLVRLRLDGPSCDTSCRKPMPCSLQAASDAAVAFIGDCGVTTEYLAVVQNSRKRRAPRHILPWLRPSLPVPPSLRHETTGSGSA